MLAFGCAITNVDVYRRAAEPGIRRYAEQGHLVLAMQASGTVARTHNTIIREARKSDDIEALVFVHQDVELLDESLGDLVREVFRDPRVALIGCVGTSNDETVAWWEGDLIVSSRGWWQYGAREEERLSFGEIAELVAARGGLSHSATDVRIVHDAVARDLVARAGSVGAESSEGGARVVQAEDLPVSARALYGCVLVISRWAMDTLEFDERFRYKYGWDIDFCRQARSEGRRCVVADLPFCHHHGLSLIDDHRPLVASHVRFSEKWRSGSGEEQADSVTRLEAEAALARLAVRSTEMYKEALERRLAREREALLATRSWRATRALRAGKRVLGRAVASVIQSRSRSSTQ